MRMTKCRSNYINTLTHRHGCQIYINSDGLKRNDRFTNNAMFKFSFQEKSEWNWEKVNHQLQKQLNERALTLLEKDLDIVVHESKEKTEETGLETVELSNEGKSA